MALLGVISCSEATDSPKSHGEELAQAKWLVTTYGDWSAYGNGQCVIGAQTFYKKKFGVALKATGVQSGNIGNCAYLGACMYWVSSIARPDSGTWDRHEWGSIMPQTYDLVIYPPTSGNPYGHVASIDHMEGSDAGNYKNMYIMDSNFGGNELKASAIHTYNLKPYGFYRLKALAGCSAHCEGNSIVDEKCNKFDCGSIQSSCVQDSLGPHCVHPACPPQGDSSSCYKGSLVSCHNGSITNKNDCDAVGKVCSDQGGLHCDTPPRGNLDSVGCSQISGWAQDPDVAESPAAVHLYFGGPAGDPNAVGIATVAASPRSDLCSNIGSCDHGFVFPTPRSLLDGQPHSLHVYAIDATGGPNVELPGSPLTLQCDAATPGTTALWRRIISEKSMDFWGFSLFQDVAPISDAEDRVGVGLSHPGPDLPIFPRFVQAESGGDLWLIDGSVRRRVSLPDAWHPTSVESWPDPKLYQVARGGDLPAAPQVIVTTGPTYWLLDTPFQPSEEGSLIEPEATPDSPPIASPPSGKVSVSTKNQAEKEMTGCSMTHSPIRPPWGALFALSCFGLMRRKRSLQLFRGTKES